MTGTLFVVATPIGNLEDFTFRGLRTLREVDLIAAEDTRRTSKLLAHYEVRKPVVSLREHNETRETPRLLARLQQGQSIALVSDAGTPTIADPGCRLVARAREEGIAVVPIPGASAVTAALSASGVPAEEFVFMGFPPSGGQARERWMERLWQEPRTTVFYESPHRIKRTLADVSQLLVTRQIVVTRELTKLNEQVVLLDIDSVIKPIGEFAIVIGPADQRPETNPDPFQVAYLFGRLIEYIGFSEIDATELLAFHYGISARKVASRVKKGLILAKRQNESSA